MGSPKGPWTLWLKNMCVGARGPYQGPIIGPREALHNAPIWGKARVFQLGLSAWIRIPCCIQQLLERDGPLVRDVRVIRLIFHVL